MSYFSRIARCLAAAMLCLPPFVLAAVGYTPGSFTVSPTGAATYSIPLAVPPGTAGMQPQLSLNYSSQGGNGLVGVGWSLGGLSAITRCPKTMATEGTSGGVDLTGNDRFCLDGQKLVVVNGTYGSNGAQYRTEIDNFTRITSYGAAGSGPQYFIAETKSGQTIEYGVSTDARIEAYGRSDVLVWAANKISDKLGNYINVVYSETASTVAGVMGAEFFPQRIEYTGNTAAGVLPYARVELVYDTTRTDTAFGYVGGTAVTNTRRLTNVQVYEGATMIRDYRLGYETGAATDRSRLTSVTECPSSSSTDCLPATAVGWQSGSVGFLAAQSTTGSNTGYADAQTLDVNGDGLQDLVYCTGSSSTWQIRFGTNSALPYLGAAISTTVTCTGYQYAKPFDYNMDGKMDLLVPHTASGDAYWYILPSLGGDFGTPINTYIVNSGYNTRPQIMDVNGDGRPDLVRYYGGTWKINLGNGSAAGLSSATIDTSRTDSQYNYAKPIDYNGDGRMDLLIPHTGSGDAYWYVLQSTGSSFASVNTTIPNSGYNNNPQVLDLNGDGRQDLAVAYSSYWRVRLNTGSGFGSETATAISSQANSYVRQVDYDNDGRMDLIGPYNSSTWWVYLSNGSGFDLINTAIPNNGYGNNPQIGDFNGDGLQDLLLAYSSVWNMALHAGVTPDLLTSITNGLGLTTTVTYLPLTVSGFYTKGSGATFPQMQYQGAMYVVYSYTVDDGLGGTHTLRYSYKGARIDLSGRGFVAFETISQEDQAYATSMSLKTIITYSQTWPFYGMVSKISKGLWDLTLLGPPSWPEISTVENTFSKVEYGPVGGRYYFPYVWQSVERTYEYPGGSSNLVSTTTATNFYNSQNRTPPAECSAAASSDYGNLTCVVVNITGGGQTFTKTTLNTYTDDATNWILGRLINAKVTSTTPTGDTQTRESSFVYNPATGLLLTETIEPNGNIGVTNITQTTTYTYDGFGNKTSATVSGADGISRMTSFGWEASPTSGTLPPYPYPAGRFQTRVTNASGQTEARQYDARYGAISRLTGPNGLATQWNHDSFGRKTKETRADGTTTNWSYTLCSGCIPSPPNNKYYVTQTTSGAPTVKVYYDLLDRELRTQTQGYNNVAIWKDTVYDTFGNIAKVSRPYYSTELPYWIYYGYDEVNRVISESQPTQGASASALLTETAYNGLTTTVTAHRTGGNSPADLVTVQVKDALGQRVSVTDAGGKITAYQYDPFGNLTRVTDPAMNAVAMRYDIRGRKQSMDDPDMGHWGYDYNSVGELIWQKDANNNEVSMAYDDLGRMVSRTEPEGISSWTYDDPAISGPAAIGKLSQVTGPGEDSRLYTYDSLGRPSVEITFIGGLPYVFTTTYDTFSRVDTVTYPQGFKAQNVYNTYGYLSAVRNAVNTGIQYWSSPSYAADGQVTMATFGNGLSTVNQYDEYGRIKGISTGVGTASGTQYLTYTYDSLSNLAQRQDGNPATHTETFTYDKLNRLTTANLAGVGTVTVGYDSAGLGNTATKSDLGAVAYKYGSQCASVHAGPHAVCQDPSGGYYNYDANGNQLTGPNGRTISYVSFNQPATLTQNGATLSFTYDADHQRLTQTGPDGTTVYIHPRIDLGAHYELQALTDGSVRHKNYIYAGKEVIAVHTQYDTGATDTRYLHKDHLGSIDTLTDEAGATVEKLSYDAWGKRRNSNWTAATGLLTSTITHHGFTGHEMLDEVGLVHMNGRIYDPKLGRFLQADPTVQAPGNPQTLNRYSYAGNNPVSYVDPSGYGFFSHLWHVITHSPIIRTIAAIALSYLTYGYLNGLWLPFGQLTAGIGAGFVGGLVASGGNLQAAAYGALSGGILAGVGNLASGLGFAQGSVGSVTLHALGGGVSSVLQGAKFKNGAFSAGFVERFAPMIGEAPGDAIGRTVTAAVVGGTASALGGGKFENGASTFGFLRLFGEVANYAQQKTDSLKQLACNSGGRPCAYDERGVLRTDGARDPDWSLNPEKAGNWLTRTGMAYEGGEHIYENNTLARYFVTDVSKIHDWFNSVNYSSSTGFYMSRGAVFDSAFQLYSFAGMPVAGLATVAGYAGNVPFDQQMLYR